MKFDATEMRMKNSNDFSAPDHLILLRKAPTKIIAWMIFFLSKKDSKSHKAGLLQTNKTT